MATQRDPLRGLSTNRKLIAHDYDLSLSVDSVRATLLEFRLHEDVVVPEPGIAKLVGVREAMVHRLTADSSRRLMPKCANTRTLHSGASVSEVGATF